MLCQAPHKAWQHDTKHHSGAMWCTQGVFAPGTFPELGLPGEWYGALEFQYPPHLRQGAYEEEGRCINTLKVCKLTSDTTSFGCDAAVQSSLDQPC